MLVVLLVSDDPRTSWFLQKRKIEDMTLKSQKADDDNKTLKNSLIRTEDDNRKVKISLEEAITKDTRLESLLEGNMKNITELSEKLKKNDERLKDMTVSRDTALRHQSLNRNTIIN